jgi:signal transduction histidine kinase
MVPARILVVFPDARSLPESIKAYEGIRRVVLDDSPRPVEFFEETLEVYRFSSAELKRNLSALLRDRYAMYPPDVVITGMRTQLDFLTLGEDAVFTNVPVIALALTEDDLNGIAPNAIPVRWNPECAATFELITRLQPQLTNLVIVGGTNPIDLKFLEPVREVAEDYADQFAITWLTNHSLPEVLAEVETMRFPGTALFYVSLTRDRSGVYRMPVEALTRIRAVSAVPIYGYHSTYIDYGLLGGHFWLVEDLGAKGGELALRLLAGEPPQAIERDFVMPSRTTVSWPEMRRFGFSLTALPDDTLMLKKPPSFWDQYWMWALGGTGVLLALISLGGVVVLRSRYQNRALREQASQRDLLESVRRQAEQGELAAAIAHELNQPLAAILSNTETLDLLLTKGASTPELAELVAEVKRDDERAGDIIRKIRALYAQRPIELERIDLNQLIQETVGLLVDPPSARSERPVIELDLEATLPLLPGDRLQLQQVLFNLISNSLEMTDGDPSVISTRGTTDGGADIAVRDSGPGVAAQDIPRLFQPYFSARPGGTGLGLAISKKIVEAHGGTLRYATHPEGGAVFTIHLPGGTA